MDAFVSMRHYINDNEYRLSNVETKVLEHDNSIKLLQELFEEDKEYFFDKEYDAYSKVLDIFKKAKSELIIVDRFTDKSILDMIKNLKCRVILITSNKSTISKLDIEKYNKSYNNLNIYYNDSIHDRYFILDRKEIYLCGSSINYIGYRGSSIVLINDIDTKKIIIDKVLKIISTLA
jgi:7-keto-8-aminopelargonate synthetase-like enzyme